ncbi:MAG: PA2779 family protein [Gammaproteobacteria bacterium]|nr:PA2779 family protein [Gammaproteobacteria bacterium]
MNLMRSISRPVAHFVICCFAMFSLSMPAAQAGMIGTDTVLSAEQRTADQAQLSQLLARADVTQKLVALGVNPADVQQRIAGLSDDELQTLAAQIDTLPAGGDALGVIVLIFLVLLFTDIMGFTNVFPFVKHGAARR